MNTNYISLVYTFSILLLFLGIPFSYSQQKVDFNNVLRSLETSDFNSLEIELKSIDTTNISTYDKATWLYYKADYNFKVDRHDIAFENILNSIELYKRIDKIQDVIDCYILLWRIASHQNELNINLDNIINETLEYALKQNDSTILKKVYHRIGANYLDKDIGNQQKAIQYFRKVIAISNRQNDRKWIAYSYANISTAFQSLKTENLDSASYYIDKAIPLIQLGNNQTDLAYIYNNRAELFKLQKKYDSAIQYFRKVQSINLTQNKAKSNLLFYRNIADLYKLKEDFEKYTIYIDKYILLKDSINDVGQNIAIANLDKKYKTAENKREILEKRNWVIALSSSLIIIITIAYFSLNSSRRKRLLALQEKELETQKNLTLLKEQEIITINAMVEGQEKERKRVAEDLHDNLGNVISTLKLHFENLRINRKRKKVDQEQLFDKTENLIDEAYQKVRSIAHAKNAGVIANQGLLVAVKLMAEKVSSANTIQLEVVDFGLEKRLENSLEIALFRIIQELTTNVIKHAQATQATINISQDENDLTILIEDNGIGMNTSQIDVKKGMGLHSIKTRIEHLNGIFTIDSTPTKGTTIIMHIPI